MGVDSEGIFLRDFVQRLTLPQVLRLLKLACLCSIFVRYQCSFRLVRKVWMEGIEGRDLGSIFFRTPRVGRLNEASTRLAAAIPSLKKRFQGALACTLSYLAAYFQSMIRARLMLVNRV